VCETDRGDDNGDVECVGMGISCHGKVNGSTIKFS
jgi:hypothetical protein